jgi:hypothetical protein
MKRPAFMFYPADWRKDPGLRVCSIAARGLWIDMLALMHEGEPYGHLVVNGEPVSEAEIARLVGEPLSVVRRLLAELEARNVFSRTDSGVIYSRRMIRDEHIRDVRAAAGKLGGNPSLKASDKGRDKGLVKQTKNQVPTPSVAVALAVADSPSEERDEVLSRPWVADVTALWQTVVDPTVRAADLLPLEPIVERHGWQRVRDDLTAWIEERRRNGQAVRPTYYAEKALLRLASDWRKGTSQENSDELGEARELATRMLALVRAHSPTSASVRRLNPEDVRRELGEEVAVALMATPHGVRRLNELAESAGDLEPVARDLAAALRMVRPPREPAAGVSVGRPEHWGGLCGA